MTTLLAKAPRLEGSAFALMVTTASTALLGVAFWAIAARLYPAVDVGRASALLSAALLLATLSQLNLGNVYGRFLGPAGHHQRRMVFVGYGAVSLLALILGTGFVISGLGAALFATAAEAWVFPLCVAILAIFSLQDMVLISLRKAAWVPVENIGFGSVKLLMLAVGASMFPAAGIGIAWMVPAAVAVLIVTFFVGGAGTRPGISEVGFLPSRRVLGHAVAGEYVAGIVSTALPLLLPLLVAHRLGVEANAYFALPWLVSTSLSLLVWNVASALLVEASADPARLGELLRRALRLSMAVAVSGAAAIWISAPTLLGLLGPDYADRGTWLLRIAVLAAPASALMMTWTTAMRLRGRIRHVIALQICTGVGILVLGMFLAGPLGVVGIGVGYVAVQVVAAAVIGPDLWRLLRRPPHGRHALVPDRRRGAVL